MAFAEKSDKVLIAKANADEHRQLGARFGVKGYPTIKWFPNGINSAPEDYKGGRDLDSLASFVTDKSGKDSWKQDRGLVFISIACVDLEYL